MRAFDCVPVLAWLVRVISVQGGECDVGSSTVVLNKNTCRFLLDNKAGRCQKQPSKHSVNCILLGPFCALLDGMHVVWH